MRLLWLSNSRRVPTGYGNQTAVAMPRLLKAGHVMAIFAFYGIEGSPTMTADGIMELPRFADPYGNDIVQGHYRYHRADAVVTLIDPFVLQKPVYEKLNWIAWTPIDCAPVLPQSVAVIEGAKRIWAMSRFGETQLKAAGFTNVDYVPHGIESTVYRPVDKTEALTRLKRDCGVDVAGKYVVAMNSANKGMPSRKGFFEAFAAFKLFSDNHADAVLYVHSETNGVYQGEHLPTIAGMVGLDARKIIYAPHYHYVTGMLPPSYLNDIYNAADVFLTTSHGEGFGIPIIEAQMAGCPVIVTDFSAMSELCLTGWKVPGTPFMAATGITQHIPLIGKVADALNAAYAMRGNEAQRTAARREALIYDADAVITTYMLPALDKAQALFAAGNVDTERLRVVAGKALHTPSGNGHKPAKKKKKVR